MARDLHDVVAHSMTMVVVRAETARYRLPSVDEASAGEFSAVADAARQALTELRGVLDVLRTDDESRQPRPAADRRRRRQPCSPRPPTAGVGLTVNTHWRPRVHGPRRRSCRRTGSSPRPWPTPPGTLAGAVGRRHPRPRPRSRPRAGRQRPGPRRGRDPAPASGCPGCASGPRRWAASWTVGPYRRRGLRGGTPGCRSAAPSGSPRDPRARRRRPGDGPRGLRRAAGRPGGASRSSGFAADGEEAVEARGRPEGRRRADGRPDAAPSTGWPPPAGSSPPVTTRCGSSCSTTFDVDDYVYEALRAGASGSCSKDAPAEELVRAVRVVAGGEALLAPSVTRRLIADFASRAVPARAASRLGSTCSLRASARSLS